MYLTDERGIRANAIMKGTVFSIHMKVAFYERIPSPIFAYSVKNIIGVEITGTNTMVEKAYLDSGEPGSVKEITFTQEMNLQGESTCFPWGLRVTRATNSRSTIVCTTRLTSPLCRIRTRWDTMT